MATLQKAICMAPVRMIHGHKCFGGKGLRRTRTIAKSIKAPKVKRSTAKKDGAKKSLAVFITTKLKSQKSHNGTRAWKGVLLPVMWRYLYLMWYQGGDSNPYTFRRQNLNLVRLPISPPWYWKSAYSTAFSGNLAGDSKYLICDGWFSFTILPAIQMKF